MVDEGEPETQVIDLVVDELALARGQLDGGLPMLAEGTARRRISQLEAEGSPAAAEELDALRTLLAEALWRLQRPLAARAALDLLRPSSMERRRPIAMMIEAEALAASGEPDRAAGMMERVLAAIGTEEAWRLRAGAPSRLSWPLPADLVPAPRRSAQPPWSSIVAGPTPPEEPIPEATAGLPAARGALARARLEAARAAYARSEAATADGELNLALRLDPTVAVDGLALLEPTLGRRPAPERLILYGDLLRAAGREAEATAAYARAAERHSQPPDKEP